MWVVKHDLGRDGGGGNSHIASVTRVEAQGAKLGVFTGGGASKIRYNASQYHALVP